MCAHYLANWSKRLCSVPGKFPDVGGRRYEGETVFISGERSSYVPESHRQAILELFPRARFEVVPGAGHWVHSEKPEQFMAVVDKYLAK